MKLKYYIKERYNPQFGTYYTACGQMTKAAAKKVEVNCLYGYDIMHSFDTEADCQKRLTELKNEKKSVR